MQIRIFFIIALLVAGNMFCSYSKKIHSSSKLTAGCYNHGDESFLFFRSCSLFRRATGLNALPDGGRSKYLYRNVSLYMLERAAKRIVKIKDMGESLYDGWPVKWRVRLSWQGDLVCYSLQNIAPVQDLDARGVYVLDIRNNTETLIDREGEMADLSGDGKKVLYLLRKGQEGTQVWQARADASRRELIKSLPDMDIVFLRWDGTGKALLYISAEKGFYVNRLDIATGVVTGTGLPYLKHYGNRYLPRSEYQNITAREWGCPEPVDFK